MQTSTTTDKASLPHRWMQPAAVLLWVLLWQLAAMAVDIPLLLPSPLAVLQRLWQLCREGEFWYTVLTSLCRILLGFAAGAMLYVVVEEMIPEMSQGRHSHIGVLAFAAGFSVMMVLDVALG